MYCARTCFSKTYIKGLWNEYNFLFWFYPTQFKADWGSTIIMIIIIISLLTALAKNFSQEFEW